MFRMVLPPIIRSAYDSTYSIWYLSHRYCYLPLSWKSWNRFEFAVGGVRVIFHVNFYLPTVNAHYLETSHFLTINPTRLVVCPRHLYGVLDCFYNT